MRSTGYLILPCDRDVMLLVVKLEDLRVRGLCRQEHFFQRVLSVVLPCYAGYDEIVAFRDEIVVRVYDDLRWSCDGAFVRMPYDYAVRSVYHVSPTFVTVDGCACIYTAA